MHFAVGSAIVAHFTCGLGSHEEAHTTAHYHSERLKESHSRVEFLKTLLGRTLFSHKSSWEGEYGASKR